MARTATKPQPEVPKLYGVHELAEASGCNRNLVNQWRYRGYLPPPDVVLAMGPIWFEDTAEAWLNDRNRK